MVLMGIVNAGNLATYDVRSFGWYHDSVVGPGYWESLSEKDRQALSALAKGRKQVPRE
jgi:hypothetical protein